MEMKMCDDDDDDDQVAVDTEKEVQKVDDDESYKTTKTKKRRTTSINRLCSSNFLTHVSKYIDFMLHVYVNKLLLQYSY